MQWAATSGRFTAAAVFSMVLVVVLCGVSCAQQQQQQVALANGSVAVFPSGAVVVYDLFQPYTSEIQAVSQHKYSFPFQLQTGVNASDSSAASPSLAQLSLALQDGFSTISTLGQLDLSASNLDFAFEPIPNTYGSASYPVTVIDNVTGVPLVSGLWINITVEYKNRPSIVFSLSISGSVNRGDPYLFQFSVIDFDESVVFAASDDMDNDVSAHAGEHLNVTFVSQSSDNSSQVPTCVATPVSTTEADFAVSCNLTLNPNATSLSGTYDVFVRDSGNNTVMRQAQVAVNIVDGAQPGDSSQAQTGINGSTGLLIALIIVVPAVAIITASLVVIAYRRRQRALKESRDLNDADSSLGDVVLGALPSSSVTELGRFSGTPTAKNDVIDLSPSSVSVEVDTGVSNSGTSVSAMNPSASASSAPSASSPASSLSPASSSSSSSSSSPSPSRSASHEAAPASAHIIASTADSVNTDARKRGSIIDFIYSAVGARSGAKSTASIPVSVSSVSSSSSTADSSNIDGAVQAAPSEVELQEAIERFHTAAQRSTVRGKSMRRRQMANEWKSSPAGEISERVFSWSPVTKADWNVNEKDTLNFYQDMMDIYDETESEGETGRTSSVNNGLSSTGRIQMAEEEWSEDDQFAE